ncbi:hypothetical protein ZEAMMB73_Zm00001d021914 [Zea mays]|uniref:Uncharacterized protein n=1 Tax=Zea mays TaxID=4577 RepID=A0A1D6IHU5_MAIZE|nr:hypothetical protein ZEAMMB73_Zm00001d021914 [Zea mays]
MRWSLRPPSSVSPIARGGPPPAPTMTASDPTPNMEIRLTGVLSNGANHAHPRDLGLNAD